jgi:hypothetical protein
MCMQPAQHSCCKGLPTLINVLKNVYCSLLLYWQWSWNTMQPILELLCYILCFTQYAINASYSIASSPDAATWRLLTGNNYRVSNKATCNVSLRASKTWRWQKNASSEQNEWQKQPDRELPERTSGEVFNKKTTIKEWREDIISLWT